jgi:hypothetical protein
MWSHSYHSRGTAAVAAANASISEALTGSPATVQRRDADIALPNAGDMEEDGKRLPDAGGVVRVKRFLDDVGLSAPAASCSATLGRASDASPSATPATPFETAMNPMLPPASSSSSSSSAPSPSTPSTPSSTPPPSPPPDVALPASPEPPPTPANDEDAGLSPSPLPLFGGGGGGGGDGSGGSAGVCEPWCMDTPCADLNGNLEGECKGCAPPAKCHPAAPGYCKPGQFSASCSGSTPPVTTTTPSAAAGQPLRAAAAVAPSGVAASGASQRHVPTTPLGAEVAFALCTPLRHSAAGSVCDALAASLADARASLADGVRALFEHADPAARWLAIKLVAWFSPHRGLGAGSVFQSLVTLTLGDSHGGGGGGGGLELTQWPHSAH